jgi:hypothetical protein
MLKITTQLSCDRCAVEAGITQISHQPEGALVRGFAANRFWKRRGEFDLCASCVTIIDQAEHMVPGDSISPRQETVAG